MKPKRLISLLVAVCMMITMLPLSAVTAFAADTSPSTVYHEASDGTYKYYYTINADGKTATITNFRGPVDSKNTGPYNITIPTDLNYIPVTGIGNYAFYGRSALANVTIPQGITSIGNGAFWQCHGLQSLTINDATTSIGYGVFCGCISLKTLSLGKNITEIGEEAFDACFDLTNVTIPEKVKEIKSGTFDYCNHLEYIILPAGLTSFDDELTGSPTDFVVYYNGKTAPDFLRDKLAGHKILCLRHVTFDAKGGSLTDYNGNLTDHVEVPVYETEKIIGTKANKLTANDLKAIPNPTRPGYNFTGWYTADNQPLNVNEIITKDITEDITFYAHWELAPKAPVCHPLTLKDGVITSVTVPGKNGADPEDITEIVKKNANEDGSFNVPEGATVSVAFDKDAFADSGLKFGHWDITGLDDPNAYQDKESFAFEMPAKGVTLKAMTQDASIEDDEPDIVGPIVIGTTVVVGGAVLGYQAYSLGAEFAGKLMALPYFPSNRSALAMMLWEDAGKPMPESELLYPDVGQEEQDMDLQHAARWAMENELIPDLNDEGAAPEEMKFFPANPVSKLDVLNAWQKAQELKNN